MKIGHKTQALIVNDVSELLATFLLEIDQAYRKFGEKKFAVNFKCELEPRSTAGLT